jgi:thioredoxin 1
MAATFNTLINSDKPVLVDFFATWCGPCKTMAPILTQLKEQIGDSAVIIKVDIDQSPGAAQTYQVQAVPTLLLFKQGKVVWRKSGVVQAAELQQIIQTHIG